jgi:hypothetical protein
VDEQNVGKGALAEQDVVQRSWQTELHALPKLPFGKRELQPASTSCLPSSSLPRFFESGAVAAQGDN